MARHSRRRAVLLMVGLGAAAASGCQAPWSQLQEDVGRYVTEVRQPLARSIAWLSSLSDFTSEARSGDLEQVACASGRLTALIDEGNATTVGLEAVQPPSAIASIHGRAVQGGKDLVAKLTNVRTLLCENHNVAAARDALDDIGGTLDDAKGWLGRLSTWLRDQ
ncbi:MAG: hypothetical protein ACYC5O_20115 [Anaerolineae bacterium]